MPIYENGESLAREDAVAQYVAGVMGCEQRKLPNLDIDREFLINGRVFCYVEVRTRTNDSAKYRTYMVDWLKLTRGLSKALRWNVPFILAVGFTDGIYGWMVQDVHLLEVKRGGRTDRGDAFDQDWCAHIPMERFVRL